MSKTTADRKLKHLFDGSDWNVYEPNILNLGVGAPGTDLLESNCDNFKKATDHCLEREKRENQSLIFQYGPTSGTFEVRREISTYFSDMFGSPVKSEDLMITTGATQGFHVLLSTMIDFQGFVFVDEYSYMIALDSIKHFTSLTIVPVKLNDDGVDLKDLEEQVSKRRFNSEKKEFWGIYYTIPTYHNPTGVLFSPEVCRGIVQLARKFDFLVVCDDVYNILHYGEKPTHCRLMSYDDRNDPDFAGHVISNSSFSKILGPGVRVGWLEVPPRLKPILDGCGFANSGGCFNNYTSEIVGSLFELKLAQKQIAVFYEAYKERMLATTQVLRDDLPKGCKLVSPTGGYFIWVRIPDHLDSREFLKYCLEHQKIFFIPGTRFSADGQSGKQFFRLSIAFYPKEKLVEGARRLCHALKEYIATQEIPNEVS
ncbi:2-aminoadipate transaminase [Drosophila ficusphila]|uniref:2-aminoadipate transaminase n=1 Tax=Drosophila ficusphila TaxID=30025 RepID=UPI0007E62CD4|nr:2-aminoadipate transaminase [Drosophila ficusphila]